MADEKINSTANNIQIDIDNLSYVDYLWTQRISDTVIKGIRLSKNNLPTDTVYRGDIPAVNDGTLIIKKNGTEIAKFTANSSTNQTANITVPTKVSELDNDKGFLTAHQSIKVLNTNNNSKLNVASETISGSGSISLNGISKTAQEEYLQWGGPSKSGSVSPIGMTLSNEHSANRMAFINGDLITAEYSSDGGTTWTEYSANAAAKSQFFTKTYDFAVGRPNGSTEVTADKSKTRITITAQNGNNPSGRVYTDPRKMLVLISSATGLELLVEYRTGTNYKNNGAWTTFGTYSLSGWSGWNDIPLVLNTIGGGSTQTGNNWQLRLTFTVKTKNASYPKTASVLAARIYGQNTWATPSTMAETGHMYTFDMSKNVTFPAGISATSFTEGGTSLANKYLGKTAKAADADKLDGHDSTYYLNLDNINDGSTRKLANYIPKSLTSTKGDMIYASAAHTPVRLGIGSNGQFLSIADGIPKWVNNPNTHNSHAIISGTKSDNSTQIKGSASSGDITLGDSGVTAGTYRSVTVNSKGIVVAGSQTDKDTNTWRKIQLNGTDKLGTGTNTNPLNIKAGDNMTITESNGTFTFDATDTDTHYINYLQIKGNGTEAVKFTQNANKSLNLKPGNNVSISAASGEITISATVPTKSSWNYDDTYVKYSTAQSLNDTQKTQARTNIGAGTITEIKVNGTSKGTSGSVNLTNMVTFASSQTATVAGTNKTTYTYNQPTGDSNTGSSNGSAYFPEGIIMGGTAASAGLVTRGICGVTTPDATTGACNKESLYINYDGTNDYQSNRQLVIQAGSVGTHYGNNLYQYAAARGDAVKSYCDATYAAKSHTHNYVATDTIASPTTLGLVKSSITGTTANKDYKVQVNPDGTMKVNVPWTNTTYTFNGAVSTIKDSNLTANRALISNGSGKVAVSNITSTELSYLDGVSSNIQTQLDTLLGYFDGSGYANSSLTAVNATKDANGNIIHSTYLTKTDASDTYVKKTYEYKSGTVVNEIFTFTSTKVVSSLLYKDGSGNSLSGIYIGNTGIQFLAPSVFQVYYESDGTAYDILTTHNMVAITADEINEICK